MNHSFSILYVSLGNMDDKSWFTTQRLALSFSNYVKILYIENEEFLLRLFRHPRRMRNSMPLLRKYANNFYVYRPIFIFPKVKYLGFLQKINQILSIFTVRFLIKILEFKDVTIWVDNLYRYYYLKTLRRKTIVYHCLHDYSTIPTNFIETRTFNGYNKQGQLLEEKIARMADVVFSPSTKFVNRLRKLNPNTYQLFMGVDMDKFENSDFCEPKDFREIPSPRITFVGTISIDKIDWNLIDYAAGIRPDLSFIFIGRFWGYKKFAREELPKKPNVFYLGEKKHSEIPCYLKLTDVCIIPYYFNMIPDLTLKFFEYLASGKPVVAPDLPQFREFKRVIYLYKSENDFISAIQMALSESSNFSEQRIKIASSHSFEKQAFFALERLANL